MSKDVDVETLQTKDNITHLEEGASHGTDNQRQVAADFCVADAEMTPVEGGHFRVKFRILHKDTQQPPPQAMFTLAFDGWGYCTWGEVKPDGWHDGIYTPSKPGPTWVKICPLGDCPITAANQVRLVYP